MREDWWPDWRGETVVIAASGPSFRAEDIAYARGRARVAVINSTWKAAPWADMLYACDSAWWKHTDPGYGQEALREFKGLKVSGRKVPGTHWVTVKIVNEMIWTGVEIGGGGNSAFQAMNLAVLWGAMRIILTGVDCMQIGEHWHGKHPAPLTQLQETNKGRATAWIDAFGQVAPALKKGGVEVLNATRETALECFPRIDIRDAL